MRIENITTKVIMRETHRNSMTYSIKCLVENDTFDEDVRIDLQGLDEDGYEIDTVSISGTIPVGESKVMTTRAYIDEKLYKQIVTWRKE